MPGHVDGRLDGHREITMCTGLLAQGSTCCWALESFTVARAQSVSCGGQGEAGGQPGAGSGVSWQGLDLTVAKGEMAKF